MTLLMAPKPALMQKVAQARAAAEKARQKAIQEGRAAPPPEDTDEALDRLEQELEDRDEADEDEEDEEEKPVAAKK